jgi:hypothetical protein
MASYWLKALPSDTAQGPYTATQIRQMAAAGQLRPAALISDDQVKWVAIARVKGLFPVSKPPGGTNLTPPKTAPDDSVAPSPVSAPVEATAAPPRPASPAAASVAVGVSSAKGGVPAESTPPVLVAPPPAMGVVAEAVSTTVPAPVPEPTSTENSVQPIPTSPAVAASQLPAVASPVPLAKFSYAYTQLRTRDVQWYLICALVILGLGVLQVGLQIAVYAAMRSKGLPVIPVWKGNYLAFNIAGAAIRLTSLAGWVGLWIYFTVWIFHVHEDMRQLTGGSYPISPAQACGFCYVPLFNVFWLVYAPCMLADAIDRELGSTGTPTSRLTIMVFQVLQEVSVFSCFCLLAPSPLFFALSMRSIQAGLNKMWLFPKNAPNQTATATAADTPVRA